MSVEIAKYSHRGAALAASLTLAASLAPSMASAADPTLTFPAVGTLGGDYSYSLTGYHGQLSADGSVAAGYSFITGNGAYHAFRWTAAGMTDLGTLGGDLSVAMALSADGSTVVGHSFRPGNSVQSTFRWTSATGMVDLGTLGGVWSTAYATSADGSVVVGESGLANSATHAFRWTSATGMVDLGTLGGSSASASGISADGTVVGGKSSIQGNGSYHAIRWTSAGGMVDLGTLGGQNSYFADISTDGSALAGSSQTAGNLAEHPFRWTSATGMVDLGSLGGFWSHARAISGDGSTVVGHGLTGSGQQHAFRWTSATGMVDLGTLGGSFSQANAVSRDGSVVVGKAFTAGNVATAFRWTQTTGMRSVPELLITSGVDLAGWSLFDASSVSADGSTIFGEGYYASNTRAWIARCVSGCGLITPEAAGQSFATVAAVGNTGNAALGGTLGSFSEYAGQALDERGRGRGAFSVFAHGLYDSDPTLSATVGATWAPFKDAVVGASIGASQIKTDMALGGSAKFQGVIGGVFAALAPDAGLQAFAGLSGSSTSGRITRGYLNGNTPATSAGDTRAAGFAATARIGWAFDQVLPQVRVTPFASLTYAATRFDGWTETGGPFPASFSAFTADETTSRLGVESRWTYDPGRWLWGSLAWGHRLDGGKSATIKGNLSGIMDIGIAGARSATDWAEVGIGTRQKIGDNGVATASLTATVPNRGVVTWMPRIGLSIGF